MCWVLAIFGTVPRWAISHTAHITSAEYFRMHIACGTYCAHVVQRGWLKPCLSSSHTTAVSMTQNLDSQAGACGTIYGMKGEHYMQCIALSLKWNWNEACLYIITIRLSLEWGMSKQTSTGFSLKWSISKRSSIGLSLKWSMKDSLWNIKELDINKALSGMEQYHVNRNLYIARWRNWRLDGAIFRSMERQQNEKRTLCV